MATTTAPVTQVSRPAIAAAMLGVFICLLDVNVVNVALPDIQRDLSGTLVDSQWVVNLYVLALAAFIIPAGILGDVLGARRMFGGAVVVFAAGSVVCGAANLGGDHAMVVLHAARFIQGVGGAFVLPLSLSLIFTYAPRESAPRLVGLWGAVGGLSTAIGPLVGGVLTDHAGWQWVFFINLPMAAVVLVSLIAVPAAIVDPGGTCEVRIGERRGVPILSALVVGGGFFALTLALTEGSRWGWSAGSTLGLFLLSAVLLVSVVVREMRAKTPLIPRYLVLDKQFYVSLINGFVIGAGAFSILFYISYYLQFAGGLTATDTGLMFLPMSAALVVSAAFGSRAAVRLGEFRLVAVGLLTIAAGVWWVGIVNLSGSNPATSAMIAPTVVIGIGMGLSFPVVSAMTVAPADQMDFGVAAASGTMARQLGNAIGVAVFGAVIGSDLAGARMAAGMRSVGIIAAVILLTCGVANLALRSRRAAQ